MKILSGTGNGKEMGVDEFNRGMTTSIVETLDKNINRTVGRQWSVLIEVTPVAADDYYFYMKNEDDFDFAISAFRTQCAASETFFYDFVSGTPSFTASTELTPVNRNSSSSLAPDGTFTQDTDITGLTNEGTFYFDAVDTNGQMKTLESVSNIILTKGKAIGLRVASGGNLVRTLISFTELPQENVR